MRYILIHTFYRPDDGAFIRVRNLNSEIAGFTAADCREVVLISIRHLPKIFNNNNDSRIFNKRVIVPILWTNLHFLGRIWNHISSWVVGMVLAKFFNPDIIVGENPRSWKLARVIRRLCPSSSLIIDLHGAVPEEVLFHYPPSDKRDVIVRLEEEQERDIVHNSDLIICQSETMIEHLKCKYPDIKIKLHSFQCSVRSKLFHFDSEVRKCYRQKLGLKENETLFAYCGSFASWQKVQYSVEIFSEYLKSYDKSAKFLIMSPSPENELLEYIYGSGLNRHQVWIIKVSHEEVPGYLNAADIGFLIRDDGVVNRVASPTKLGEYLACGLPVVVGNVAHSWPAAKLDSSCFCFVDLNNPQNAAYAIQRFLQLWNARVTESRQSSVSLALHTLSNQLETERLQKILNDVVLDQIK